MNQITPHLWFDKEAREAAEFYVSLFPGSKIQNSTILHNTPSGDAEIIFFELSAQPFMAISAGPLFRFNPSISFHAKCNTVREVDALWEKFEKGGKVRMPLGKYPFSERYGWVEDRYGLSWQVIHVDNALMKQRFTPILMFTDRVCGKAEEAVNFYAKVFKSQPPRIMARYEKGEAPDREGTVKYASFSLLDEDFGAMDSARVHGASFNEAISFIVPCETQEEVDYYWDKLSADPKAEQCGWLKDQYGVSWQIVPTAMNKMMTDQDQERTARVTRAFLKMKKVDIAALERAYEGR
jgi:predicted 3-demethylubiquinone-9 3-methyltransferase (glyoxalase superfamily)